MVAFPRDAGRLPPESRSLSAGIHNLSKEFVDLIAQLYGVERLLPKAPVDPSSPEEGEVVRAERLRIRQERSKPVIAEIRELALAMKPEVPERSVMGKAIVYMLKLWPGLTVFLDNPLVPLDNNHAERALRGVVVGRKNHYGSRSRRGTEVAACFYTLFETAKLSNVNPAAYVLTAARRALQDPDTVTLPQSVA